ncbi:MAG: alpha/beta hydrolase [Vibrio sp.]
MTDTQPISFTSLEQLSPQYSVLPLWPLNTLPSPALTSSYIERGNGMYHDRLTTNTAHPEMTIVTPAQPNGIGVLLIPGGGYTKIAYDNEGTDIAEVMTGQGYTCFILNYRLPGDGHDLGARATLADAQRAMRIIRHQQATWQLTSLGVVGFSAGGHLAGWLSTMYQHPIYSPYDECDECSARPDFMGLIYPVITMNENIPHLGSRQQLLGTLAYETLHPAYSVETMVHPDVPPCFLLHANDDTSVSPENSLIMWQALKAHHIPVELHLVEQGGHGFGIRQTSGLPVASWLDWLNNWICHHKLA